jgi:hypothetical protein
MKRRVLFLWLCAAIPGLVCAQETKLVNCRTLAAAGNFVGPDEVVVNDVVCQKVKGGTEAVAQPQAPRAVEGAVASQSGETTSVVDAAKAANKRVAAAQDAIRERATEADEEKAAPTEPGEPGFVPTGPAAPAATPSAPAPTSEPSKAPEVAPPTVKPKMSLPVKAPVLEIDASVQTPAEPNQTATASAPEQAEPVAKPAENSVAAVAGNVEPTSAAVASSSADLQQTASREPIQSAVPEAAPNATKVAPSETKAEVVTEDHQAECGKNKWWKPWVKCKAAEDK